MDKVTITKEQARKMLIDEFHKMFYDKIGEQKPSWRGYEVNKSPLDLFIFQEIIHDVKPNIIIECGTSTGGSALFFSDIQELIGVSHRFVVTIDNNPSVRKLMVCRHNIVFLTGRSTDDKIVKRVKSYIEEDDVVLVNLDSGHDKATVLEEMKIYGELVTKGSYMIVEGGNINGHPVLPHWDYGEGPFEALEEFMKDNKDFVVDKKREHFLFSFNPNGYLLKVK